MSNDKEEVDKLDPDELSTTWYVTYTYRVTLPPKKGGAIDELIKRMLADRAPFKPANYTRALLTWCVDRFVKGVGHTTVEELGVQIQQVPEVDSVQAGHA